MSMIERPRPLKEAARITKVLDTVLGDDRFDRGPVDIQGLAMEYSKKIAPNGPIQQIVESDIQAA